MSSVNAVFFFAIILVLNLKTVTSDFLSPLLSPIFDAACKEVECGKGKCKASSNSSLMFECECDDGWKQFDDNLKFLPCIIPNCTFDFACGESQPSPVQQRPSKDNNISFLDPCQWTDCGGGSCNKTSAFTYRCECQAGYNNLLNVSAFPCFKQCALDMDCLNLGIPVPQSPKPALADSSKNQAGSNWGEYSCWWIILVRFMSVILLWI